jgi:hypothetical protein
VAEALKMGVTDLLLELLAHAFCVLRPLQTAGAIAAGSLKPFPNGGDDLFIRIQRDLHKNTSFCLPVLCGISVFYYNTFFGEIYCKCHKIFTALLP